MTEIRVRFSRHAGKARRRGGAKRCADDITDNSDGPLAGDRARRPTQHPHTVPTSPACNPRPATSNAARQTGALEQGRRSIG
jgi:hypothetical protein